MLTTLRTVKSKREFLAGKITDHVVHEWHLVETAMDAREAAIAEYMSSSFVLDAGSRTALQAGNHHSRRFTVSRVGLPGYSQVGRDANRIADEVIAHLSGLVGARVTVTLEVEAEIPSGRQSRWYAPSPRTAAL